MARRSKRKIDFVNYINYEKKLIELIKIRRKVRMQFFHFTLGIVLRQYFVAYAKEKE